MPEFNFLMINGSHRKGRNTFEMLKYVQQVVLNCGHKSEIIELIDYNIQLCKACNKCLNQNECYIQDDDMNLLGQKLLNADGIVLGSPVYWGNVTTLMKNFMDRTRWLHIPTNLLAGKVGGSVVHAALRNGYQSSCMTIIERFFREHGIYVVDSRDPLRAPVDTGACGTIYSNYSLEQKQIHWHSSVRQDKLAIRACHQLGVNMINLIKKLKGL